MTKVTNIEEARKKREEREGRAFMEDFMNSTPDYSSERTFTKEEMVRMGYIDQSEIDYHIGKEDDK